MDKWTTYQETQRQHWSVFWPKHKFDLPSFWRSRSIPIVSAGSTYQLLTCIQIGPQDDWWNRSKWHHAELPWIWWIERENWDHTREMVISHLGQIHTSGEAWRDWRPCAHAHSWQDQYSHLACWNAFVVQKPLKSAKSISKCTVLHGESQKWNLKKPQAQLAKNNNVIRPWEYMRMHADVWECMAMYGNEWQCMGIDCNVSQCMAMYRNVLQPMGMYGNAWECMGMYGNACECMGMYGKVWECMAMHGNAMKCKVM